jgi:hypothetical protein
VVRPDRIGWQQAVDWLILICDAVQSAHDHGVLHRDIKPANILMAPEGPRLTDFGISCLSDATCPGQGWSLLHAPPELLDNRSDRRSDVYSLGSTLFTLIAGHAPFELPATDSTEAVLARLATAPPPRLPANLAPPWLDELLQLALAKDPGDRPQTVADLQSALEAGRGAGHQGTGDGEGRRPLLAIEEAAELRPLLAAAADRWTGIDGAGVPAPTPVHRRLPGRAVALGAAVLVALAGLAVVVVLDQGEGEGAGEAQHTFAPVEIGDDVVVSRRWRLAGGGTLLEAQLDVTNEGPSAFMLRSSALGGLKCSFKVC